MAISEESTGSWTGTDNGSGGAPREIAVTVTVPAAADSIVIVYGGWSNNQATDIDIDGNTGIVTRHVNAENGVDQVASIFSIEASHANFPSGSTTFTTVSSGATGDQRRMGVAFYSGVHQSSPLRDSGTQTGSIDAASITLSSTQTGDYCIGALATYTGDGAALAGDETEIYRLDGGGSYSSYLGS